MSDYPTWAGLCRLFVAMRRLAVRDLRRGNVQRRIDAYLYLLEWL